jgi:hypothetical protein
MTNLNSYTIDNYLYKIGDTLKLGKDTLKIESIVSINDTVFFFCSKLGGHFHSRVSENITISLSMSAMPALLFHHHAKLSLLNNPEVV